MPHYERRLPHWDTVDQPLFVTFRLHGSLPAHRVFPPDSLAQSGRAFVTMDRLLDRGTSGPLYLQRPALAQMVVAALHDGEQRFHRYQLHAYVVMPNHVHALAAVKPECSLAGIVHSWKSYSAKRANRILGRTGAFWAKEYFDRFMRDDEHLATTAAYIEGNPVKAGLCQEVSDWRFSSAWHDWSGRDARGPHTAQPQ